MRDDRRHGGRSAGVGRPAYVTSSLAPVRWYGTVWCGDGRSYAGANLSAPAVSPAGSAGSAAS